MRRIALALLLSALMVSCGDDKPAGPPGPTGSITVSTSTTGADTPSSYTVVVDGSGGQPIGVNASVTVSGLAPGSYAVGLADVASNCAVEGANPRSVTVTESAAVETTFQIVCEELTGQLQVTTLTTGDPVRRATTTWNSRGWRTSVWWTARIRARSP